MKKNSYITFLLFLTMSLSANELSWVNKQIEAIKPAREGVQSSVISDLDDPFIFYKKSFSKKVYKQKAKYISSKTNSSKSSASSAKISGFSLGAIMNKSALINGKWYKQSDKIGRYDISAVNNTSVVLTRNGKKSLLYMSDKNNNLKFKR